MMKEEMGKMKEKKMRTMYFQNLEMKEISNTKSLFTILVVSTNVTLTHNSIKL